MGTPELSDDENDEEEAKKEVRQRATMGLPELSRRAAALPLLPRFDGFGLAATVAAMNHSCEPNVEVDCVTDTELVATMLRDVAAGEELFICYIDETLPRGARQRSLMQSHGFTCRC